MSVIVNTQAIEFFLRDARGPAGSELRRRARRVEAHARAHAPVKTGRLRSSIRTKVDVGPGGLRAQVGTFGGGTGYAIYQEFGTGPITPVRASVLVFEVDGTTVFTKRTRGVPATHYLSRALREASG